MEQVEQKWMTIYIVHSDIDENNVAREFEDLDDALYYAKEHIEDETYVVEQNVLAAVDGSEIYDFLDEEPEKLIWAYNEEE